MMKLLALSAICILLPWSIHCAKRQHSRRSVLHDSRYLGFRFDAEPSGDYVTSDSIVLNCQYTLQKDVKEVRLEWRKDGSLLDTKNGRWQLLSNGSLSIDHPSSSDEGNYQCMVHVHTETSSVWTYVSRKAQINLPDLPKFKAQPVDRTTLRGKPISFHCLTDAHPVPTVTWYHDEVQIESGSEYHILPISNSLEINSVQSRHEGEYKCVAEGAGKRRTSQTGKLRLVANLALPDISFISAPRPETKLEGEYIILECLAVGKETPEVRWLKDSRQVAIDGNRIRRVGISSLHITSLTLEDAGLYTCRASNTDDSNDQTVALVVQSAPHITTRPTDKLAIETADVELECLASGRPIPSITWKKNGEAIIPSEYFVIEANRLRILGLVRTDEGVYQCLAENEVGSVQASVQLLVDSAGPTYLETIGLNGLSRFSKSNYMSADDSTSVAGSSGQPLVPSAPLGLRAVTVGSRVISLEWDPPVQMNGQIMRYHVSFKEDDINRERIVNTSSTNFALTGLQPAHLYVLSVYAENEAGIGKASDHIKVTTKREQAVPGRVENLVAKALGSETIEVFWDPPKPSGIQAKRYKLFYIKHPSGDEKETQIITSATTYTFHGMEKYTEYHIRVEADGDNGSGLSSEIVKIRTHSDIPREPPRSVATEPLSSTSVRVSWKEPLEGVNGDITGYRVRYKHKLRSGNNHKGSTFVIDATEREYTITDLERDTAYLVKVAVVNHNGTGEYSDWIPVTTLVQDKEEALLGAPRELRPKPGSDYILLSWLPPADDSVIVRGYQVGWGHNIPDVSTARVAGNVLQYRITGLKPGREYILSLRASNKHGVGFPIYETVRTITPSMHAVQEFDDTLSSNSAMTPVGVRAETMSSSAVKLSWTDPDVNAFNSMYTVRYSTSADGNQMRSANTSDTFVTVDNLSPATEYEFTVRSIISTGEISQWSMAVRNRTFSAAPTSAPRDLTVLPAASGDPHSVSINWQPPKFPNGEIEEYIIFYTDRPSLSDKDWIINYVPGDRLSHHISNLLPKAAYHFKIQCRNEKGYGPLSSLETYVPVGVSRSTVLKPSLPSDNSKISELTNLILNNPLYLGATLVLSLLFVLCIIFVAVCAARSSTKQKCGYTQGRKAISNPNGDLWINHPGGNHVRGAPSDYMVDAVNGALTERLTGPEVVESPPPRYQALQDSAYGTVSVRHSRTRQSVSSYEEDRRTAVIVGRAKPYLPSDRSYNAEDSQGGSLARSYHQSSNSLEGRQRTPQVVYTGGSRHQPIARIDLNDSPYGSSTGISTPPLPGVAPPSGPPIVDGYRTLRGTPQNANPLRSFTQLAGAAPPQMRPVVIAAGGRQLPVGRATAQPRVNVSNLYSPYASCSSDQDVDNKTVISNDLEMKPTSSISDIQPSNSTEELNLQMENLDTMIDDLQKFQHEFDTNSVPA